MPVVICTITLNAFQSWLMDAAALDSAL